MLLGWDSFSLATIPVQADHFYSGRASLMSFDALFLVLKSTFLPHLSPALVSVIFDTKLNLESRKAYKISP